MIVFFHGSGTHARQVAARIRLGHGDGQNGVAADTAGQESLALLLIAKAGEIGADQATVQGVEPVTRPGISWSPR